MDYAVEKVNDEQISSLIVLKKKSSAEPKCNAKDDK